jgi:hypothetical protein
LLTVFRTRVRYPMTMWGLVVYHVTHHVMNFPNISNHIVMLGSSSFPGRIHDRGEWFEV